MKAITSLATIAALALVVAGCGATTPTPQERRLAQRAFRTVPHSARAQASLARLLAQGRDAEAGALVTHTIVANVDSARLPTLVIFREQMKGALEVLPPKARQIAQKMQRHAAAQVALAEVRGYHTAELRQEAAEAEESYPQAYRRALLHGCEKGETAALCECALHHLEAHTPFARVEAEPRATGKRLVGFTAKCELEGVE